MSTAANLRRLAIAPGAPRGPKYLNDKNLPQPPTSCEEYDLQREVVARHGQAYLKAYGDDQQAQAAVKAAEASYPADAAAARKAGKTFKDRRPELKKAAEATRDELRVCLELLLGAEDDLEAVIEAHREAWIAKESQKATEQAEQSLATHEHLRAGLDAIGETESTLRFLRGQKVVRGASSRALAPAFSQIADYLEAWQPKDPPFVIDALNLKLYSAGEPAVTLDGREVPPDTPRNRIKVNYSPDGWGAR